MKRILFISHYSGIGGANLSLFHLILNMQKYGDISPVVFLPTHGPIESYFKEKDIRYEIHHFLSWRIEYRGRLRNFLRCIIMLILNIFQTIRLSYRIHKEIDVIYSNSSKVFLGSLLSMLTCKPLIWHLREFGREDYNLNYLLSERFTSWFMEKADYLIAISNVLLEYYKKNICKNGRYVLIYNGIEENDYKDINRINHSGFNVCIAGGLSVEKNQEDLVLAANDLLKRGYSVNFDIYGDYKNQYGDYIKSLIEKLGIVDYVHLKGICSNINHILPTYDVGVITSKNEAFGRVIIEYMFSHLAVVASDAGACPELIKDRETGLLYKLGDFNDLSMKIESLIVDKVKMNRISSAGSEYALKYFTAKNNALKIIDLLNNIENKV